MNLGKRITIIGCSGSGKSTLAITLGKILNLPVIHLDKLFWLPGWVEMPQDAFDRKVTEIVMQDKWIIDGNFNRLLDIRLARCSTVIFLDFPRPVCLFRIVKRLIMNRGKTRADMGEGCIEKIDREFIQWVWNFNKRFRQENLDKVNKHDSINKVILKNPKQLQVFIERHVSPTLQAHN